ncbi:hypothetical protein D3C86_1206310 [compost metagenome]
MQVGHRFRANPPHQHQREETEEGIEHLAAEQLHQHACHQRPDTRANTIGHQQHRRQGHPAIAFDMVVGERHCQWIQAELHQRTDKTGDKQNLQRHLRHDRQRQCSQCQAEGETADQHGPVVAIGQPAQWPLHQQPGKNAATHEQTDLLRGQPLLRGIQRCQTVERTDDQACPEHRAQ